MTNEVTYVVYISGKTHPYFMTVNICILNYILFSAFQMAAGSDYEAGPYIVTFTAGEMYATLMVSTMDDNITELSEYFKVLINSTDQPGVVEIGSSNMSSIFIEDNDPGKGHILSVQLHLSEMSQHISSKT